MAAGIPSTVGGDHPISKPEVGSRGANRLSDGVWSITSPVSRQGQRDALVMTAPRLGRVTEGPLTEERRGFALGLGAFGMWGVFPLFWPLLEPSGATEILAHRIVWSLLVTTVMLLVTQRFSTLAAIWRVPRRRYAMTVAGIVICFNWGTYIWGVNNGHVVDTSLGYYINPLVTVLMGVVFLRERLRPWQWTALGIAFAGVLVLSAQVGHPPWISLILAFSFGTYGLVKKQAAVGPIEGLTWEALVLVPFAFGYLVWLTASDRATAWSQGPWHIVLLILTGVITTAPLLCFAGAANRISLTTLGLLQYLAPTIQLILGVTLLDEAMTTVRWIGFSIVWLALAVFTVESVVAGRRRRVTQRERSVEAIAA
jgi:chloramphenicol-sensitive protein RarD